MPPTNAPPAKKGGDSFGGILKKKGPGGIPYWAYTIAGVLLAYLLYRWYANRSGSNSASNTTPASDATQPASSDTGGSPATDTSGDLGGGAGGDNSGGYGYGGWSPNYGGPPLAEGTNPSATTPIAGSSALVWGEQNFTTRAQFNAYLKSHGRSVTQFATLHPAAYAEYLALPAGSPSGAKTAGKAPVKTGFISIASIERIAKGLTKTGVSTASTTRRPAKAANGHAFKSPLSGHAATVTTVDKRTVAAPATLINTTAQEVAKAAKPPAPIKAPGKTTVKPRPEAHPVLVKPAVKTPPRKARK